MPPIGGAGFSAFLNQPLDEVVIQLIWMFGWIPIVVVVALGLMQTWVEIQRKHWRAHRPYILLAIDVPRLTEQSPKAVENIFGVTVALKSSPVWLEKYLQGKNMWRHSFEMTSINGYIQFYIWTEERYRDTFEASVYAQYPDAEISLVEDYTKAVPHSYPNEEYDMWGSEYVLDRENFFPVRTWVDFEHSASRDDYLKDPLVNLFEGMAMMKPGEQLWFQVVTEHAGDDWKKEGDEFINKTFGVDAGTKKKGAFGELVGMVASVPGAIVGDVFGIEPSEGKDPGALDDIYKAFKVTEQEREITKAVVRKIAKPGLKCKIRVVYIARKEIFSKVTRKDLVKGTLKQLQHGDLNKFGGHGSPEDDYFWQVWWYSYYQNKLMEGYVNRSTEIGAKPFVLNTEELATIWHFPTVNVKAPLIKKTLAKRAEPPTVTPFASEQDELLTAPSMVLPPDQQGEDAAPQEVDIFTAPMSVPPLMPEIPEELVEQDDEEQSVPPRKESAHAFDQPIMTAPTKGMQKSSVIEEKMQPEKPSVEQIREKIVKMTADESVQEALSTNEPQPETPTPTKRPSQASGQQDLGIPDGIRVLIQPGVEPEDVGIHGTIEDDL